MDDRVFEEYVAELCRRDGCTKVERVGRSGDLGADVIGYLPDDMAWIDLLDVAALEEFLADAEPEQTP
jgi:hypothetical protein